MDPSSLVIISEKKVKRKEKSYRRKLTAAFCVFQEVRRATNVIWGPANPAEQCTIYYFVQKRRMTDISNHEDDSDHGNLTEDETSYEANAQDSMYMVNKEKAVKASTSKKKDGHNDSDKVNIIREKVSFMKVIQIVLKKSHKL